MRRCCWSAQVPAGGDPWYVARRCLAIASEDVGNANPRAMQVAIGPGIALLASARRKVNARLFRRLYLACAPKSNAVYTAFKAALAILANARIMTYRFICVMRRRNYEGNGL
ncbi:hypothetical protein ACNKHR_02105 [Shigella flexneri]